MLIIKKVILTTLIFALLFGSIIAVKAVTIAELQAQISDIQNRIAQLHQQIVQFQTQPQNQSTTAANDSLSITSISGPTSLNVGQEGTWTINTSGLNSGLSYAVSWPDESSSLNNFLNSFFNSNADQTFTSSPVFSHAFSSPGTYSVQFYAKDNAGNAINTLLNINVVDINNSNSTSNNTSTNNSTSANNSASIISFSANQTDVKSGETVTFSSNLAINGDYTFSISLDCQSGISAAGSATCSTPSTSKASSGTNTFSINFTSSNTATSTVAVYGSLYNTNGYLVDKKYVVINVKSIQADYTCSDSDGGVNYYAKGTVNFGSQNYADYCTGSNEIIEYSCSNYGSSGYQVNSTTQYCNYGCSNGACSNQSPYQDYYYDNGYYDSGSGSGGGLNDILGIATQVLGMFGGFGGLGNFGNFGGFNFGGFGF
jgi:plastocyanin